MIPFFVKFVLEIAKQHEKSWNTSFFLVERNKRSWLQMNWSHIKTKPSDAWILASHYIWSASSKLLSSQLSSLVTPTMTLLIS